MIFSAFPVFLFFIEKVRSRNIRVNGWALLPIADLGANDFLDGGVLAPLAEGDLSPTAICQSVFVNKKRN